MQSSVPSVLNHQSPAVVRGEGRVENILRDNSKDSRMPHSRLIGGLFLSAIVLYGVGNGLVSSVTGTPGFLATISAQYATLALGSVLMLSNSVVVLGLGILFFAVIDTHSRTTALIYLSARTVEAVLLAMGVVCLLMLAPLGQNAVQTGEADAAWANGVASLLTHANSMSYQIAMISLGIGGVFLCSQLARVSLVPRALAVWGAVGYAIFLVGAVAEVFGMEIGLLLSIPGGLFEVALGVWLLVRGFDNHHTW